jgi:hypothetical protein
MKSLLLSAALIMGLLAPIGASHAQTANTVTATCKDGTTFSGTKRTGTCRGHGGVQSWDAAPAGGGAAAAPTTTTAPTTTGSTKPPPAGAAGQV